MDFGKSYGHGAPVVLMCLALPGAVLTGRQLSDSHDSLRHGAMRVYAHSSQILPLFLTNRENEALARKAADELKDFFLSHLQPQIAAGSTKQTSSRGSDWTQIINVLRGA